MTLGEGKACTKIMSILCAVWPQIQGVTDRKTDRQMDKQTDRRSDEDNGLDLSVGQKLIKTHFSTHFNALYFLRKVRALYRTLFSQ